MKNETITMKVLTTITIMTGIIITSYGIKDTRWESEEVFCIGPGLIIVGLVIKYWVRDSLINKLETKRAIIKISELFLFTTGIIIFCYGLKNTSSDSEQVTIIGGVLLALGYFLRDWAITKNELIISNSSKLYFVIFALTCLSFLSSIYSNSQDCNCVDKLNDIENKIQNLERY